MHSDLEVTCLVTLSLSGRIIDVDKDDMLGMIMKKEGVGSDDGGRSPDFPEELHC